MPATPRDIAESIEKCFTAKQQAASTSLHTAKTLFLGTYSQEKVELSHWAEDALDNRSATESEKGVAEKVQKLFKHEHNARTSKGVARTIFISAEHEVQKQLTEWSQAVMNAEQSPSWNDCPAVQASQSASPSR